MIELKSKNEKYTLLAFNGSFEVGREAKIKEEMTRHGSGKGAQLILDFSGVNFIDSACLGALIGMAKNIRKTKGEVSIYGLTEDVDSIFRLTRLDKIFPLFDTLPEAVASIDT